MVWRGWWFGGGGGLEGVVVLGGLERLELAVSPWSRLWLQWLQLNILLN